MSKVLTADEVLSGEFPEPKSIAENLLLQGETVLFMGRQKEGKSTLALQIAIDIARGDRFLGRFATLASDVMYIDYENRCCQLKRRLIDLAEGGQVNGLSFVASDQASGRDVALFGKEEY